MSDYRESSQSREPGSRLRRSTPSKRAAAIAVAGLAVGVAGGAAAITVTSAQSATWKLHHAGTGFVHTPAPATVRVRPTSADPVNDVNEHDTATAADPVNDVNEHDTATTAP
jgi:hypothetical protein